MKAKSAYLKGRCKGLEDAKELVRLHVDRILAIELDTLLVQGILLRHRDLSNGKLSLDRHNKRCHHLVEPIVRRCLTALGVVRAQLGLDIIQFALNHLEVGLQLRQRNTTSVATGPDLVLVLQKLWKRRLRDVGQEMQKCHARSVRCLRVDQLHEMKRAR